MTVPFVVLIPQPYFCGQAQECHVLGSEWALQKAKDNVDRWYPVVGVLEDLEDTIAVLEHKIPSYFKGFTKFYNAGIKSIMLLVSLSIY